jgi:hypothetical protein
MKKNSYTDFDYGWSLINRNMFIYAAGDTAIGFLPTSKPTGTMPSGSVTMWWS